MKFSKPIGKYTSILTVSLLVGTGAAPALADDASSQVTMPTRDWHVTTSTHMQPTRARAEQNPTQSEVLWAATTPTRDRRVTMSARAQADRDRAEQNPTQSEALWARFQNFLDIGN